MGRTSSPLTLVVNADIDAFTAKTDAMKRAFSAIEAGAKDFREEFDKAFDNIMANPAVTIAKMTSGLRSEIETMKREASQAAMLGKDFHAEGGMTSAQSLKMADNYDKVAAALRVKMEAALAAGAADERMALSAEHMANQLHPMIRETEAYSKSLREQAALLGAMETQQGGVQAQMASLSTHQQAATVSAGQMRMGMQQLGYQIGDVATQFSLGAPPMMIFAGQGMQVVQSLQLMQGETKGLLGFIGGTWGMIIMAAATVLMTLAMKMDLFSNEAAKASHELNENAQKLDALKAASNGVAEAQSALGEMYDLSTGKLKSNNEQLRLNVQLMEAKLRAEAEAAKGTVGDASHRAGQRSWSAIWHDNTPLLQAGDSRNTNAQANLNLVQAHPEKISEVMAWAVKQNFDSLNITKEEYLDALLRASEIGSKTATADKIKSTLDSGKLDPGLRRPDTGHSGSGGNASALGNATALLEQGFAGIRITARQNDHKTRTADGKISDHAVGRAIDFVLPGRMSPSDFDGVKAQVEEMGFKIRRNASGKEQFFGPGHGPKGPGDRSHDNHYHLAFDGSPTPEAFDRSQEVQADRRRRSQDAYTQAMDRAEEDRAALARAGVTDAEELARLDKGRIIAQRARESDATLAAAAEHHWTKAQTDALQAQQTFNALGRARAVDQQLAKDLSAKDIDTQIAALEVKNQLLDLDGQLAPTLRERLRIAQLILENDRKLALLHNDKALVTDQVTQGQHDTKAGDINSVYDGRKQIVDRQNAGPVDQYRQRIKDSAGDMNTALEAVKADGLQGLEDGLVGIISGTESVSGAFKKMAASILADLARIAVQKLILSVLGLKDGGFVGGGKGAAKVLALASGGHVSGPGGPREDRVPAMLSNGEFVVNAAATRRHRRVLEAINDNAIPHFADGGIIGNVSAINYPRVPSIGSLNAGGVQQLFSFDLRGAITTPELLAQVNAQVQRVGMAAMLGGSEMAQQEMSDRRMQAIPS